MRLTPLVALIMKSRTYQLGAEPDPTQRATTRRTSPGRSVRLLPAEVLLDAIGQVLGRARAVRRRSRRRSAPCSCPGRRRAATFLKAFGKPERLLTCECERSETTHPGPGVPAHQRRGGPAQARGRRTTGSAGSSQSGRDRRGDPRRAVPRRALPRADATPNARRSSPTSPGPRTAARRGKTWPGRS